MAVPVRGPSMRAAVLAVSAVAVLVTGLRATSVVDDAFDGTRLVRSRWSDISQGGAVSVNAELAMTTSDSAPSSKAAVLTQYRYLGAFDVQVNYRIGNGWSAPIDPALGGAHIEIALGMYEDDSRLVRIARAKDGGGEGFNSYNTYPGQEAHNSVSVGSSAASGALRITRAGSVVTLSYFADASWHTLDVLATSTAPARVFLAVGNVGVARQLSAYFDDFAVNAGETSYREYTRPSSYLPRPDVALGGVSTDYLALRTWNATDWKGIHPLDSLTRWGMRWLRVGVLTTSSSYLRDMPPERWNTLPWRDEYWGCREYAAQMMREASARGMRLNGYLWLSDTPAHGGIQHAPPEWAGLTVSETAVRLEAYGYEAVKYFMDRGLNVEIWDLGNEIDTGILEFRPNERIALPPGIDITMNMGWMRENIWNVEAVLLKAVIAGVKRANPQAKLVLHIGGLLASRTNLFAESFFKAMVDSQVPFDYAGLSLPYAESSWDLDKYTTVEWFARLQQLADFVGSLNKPVLFSEGAYPNRSVGEVAAPMQEFPFTPTGQAAWIREHLRFVSHTPTVAGWFYYMPDAYPGLNNGNTPANLQSSGLFVDQDTPRPGLLEYLGTTAFADDPLSPRTTAVRALHIAELRTRVDVLRGRYGLDSFSWTDPTLLARATPVRATHLLDIRNALSEAYVAAGREPPSYSNTISAGLPIRANDVAELRTAVSRLW